MKFKMKERGQLHLSPEGKQLILDLYESNMMESVNEALDTETRSFHSGKADGIQAILLLLGVQLEENTSQS
ncbi:hypothetical protein C3744_05790 [Priestia megaterium]|uniref:Uncharacterized protein n=1 Tax=Priestia megaterium TaxID=1404 RepID=A0A3D8X9A9_PRIMG|nr:hypothetical protein [Priestia megaterium]MDH3169922.1 hypothetical protein [Priestia megaterium]RDZ18379.1 hypothetical protein C3744_05790 [Priestia megaterium]